MLMLWRYSCIQEFIYLDRGSFMKKSFSALILAMFMMSGCGGGGDSREDSPTAKNNDDDIPKGQPTLGVGKTDGKYNLWEYVTPKSDRTNNFVETTGSTSKNYKTTYSTTSNKVTEVSSYAKDEQTIYTKTYNNTLKKYDRVTVSFEKDGTPNGSYDLDLTADVGDVVTVKESSCKLAKHHSSIQINGQSFKDVIEIQCNQKPGFYQKGVGEIAQTKVLGANGNRTVRVLSN